MKSKPAYDDYDEILKYFQESLLKASKIPYNRREKRIKRIKNLLKE